MTDSQAGPCDSEGQHTAGISRDAQLADVFGELAETLVTDFDLIELLHLVAKRTVDLLDPVAAVVLLLVDQRGQLRVLVSTHDHARAMGLVELQGGEGPAADCLRSGTRVVDVDPTVAEVRWPVFNAKAVSAGYSSVAAFPLRMRETVVGILNVYCLDGASLGPDHIVVAQALADIAAVGMLAQYTGQEDQVIAEHLQAAINGRILVERATGAIAERLEIDMQAGLALLRNLAKTRGSKITAVAAGVIDGSISPEYLQPKSGAADAAQNKGPTDGDPLP